MSKKRRPTSRGKQPLHSGHGPARRTFTGRELTPDRPPGRGAAAGAPVPAHNPARHDSHITGSAAAEHSLVDDPSRMATAYDQDLLDRARSHWRRGDWASLQELAAGEIEHHPDRARLALLAAAGHHAAGLRAPARLFAQMAAEWGCDRALIARVLIGGVHNTLGRAAVAAGRHRGRALRHFEQAVAAGAPGGASALAMQTRMENQLGQMGLAADLPQLRAASMLNGRAPVLSNPLAEIGEQLRKQNESLTTTLKTQQNELANVRKALESTVKREVLNATKQLEAFVNLQGYLTKGVVVPEMHGWPISPDFALLLVGMLEATDYDLIIEFGSGSSTALMATVLARNSARHHTKQRVEQVAFEHLEKYHFETARQLAAGGLGDAVDLVLSPLIPFTSQDGMPYSYYECNPALSAIAERMPALAELQVLVLVDGPPGTTGPLARYPALAHVMEHFRGSQIDILLDDYGRPDEKEVANRWMADIKTANLQATFKAMSLEKGACLISIR